MSLAWPEHAVHAQQVSIPVAFHRQERSLSCEVATLKIALSAHNITVSEDQLVSQLPFDPTPKQPGIWGDPQRGFVGDINGRMLVTGYGVYWEPIARLGARYAHTQVIRNSSPTQLAQHVAAGNPVIIWGHYGPLATYSWQTPAGSTVQAIDGEHTRVVYGFDGSVANPTRFYLMDPSFGAQTWSTQELMNNWSSFNHSGVAVMRQPRWVRVPGETKVWEISSDGTKRHWVTSWTTLERRGGAGLIAAIDAQRLAAYSVGQPIN